MTPEQQAAMLNARKDNEMKVWFWKLRYALCMWNVVNVNFSLAWQCAESWVEAFGIECSPSEAVWEELSCWGE